MPADLERMVADMYKLGDLEKGSMCADCLKTTESEHSDDFIESFREMLPALESLKLYEKKVDFRESKLYRDIFHHQKKTYSYDTDPDSANSILMERLMEEEGLPDEHVKHMLDLRDYIQSEGLEYHAQTFRGLSKRDWNKYIVDKYFEYHEFQKSLADQLVSDEDGSYALDPCYLSQLEAMLPLTCDHIIVSDVLEAYIAKVNDGERSTEIYGENFCMLKVSLGEDHTVHLKLSNWDTGELLHDEKVNLTIINSPR